MSKIKSVQYNFIMNFILLVVSYLALFIFSTKTKTKLYLLCRTFSIKQILNILTRTLSSNMSAMISVVVLVTMNISLYTILTSSLALIGSALASRFYFKEPMPLCNFIAVLFAILAIILSK